jgi:hypothetical protein
MGQVSSRMEDVRQLYIRDQGRCTLVMRYSNMCLVNLNSIRISDSQGNEVVTVNVKKNGGSDRLVATNENKRPIEFMQVIAFLWIFLT